jgi:hypothetical protein
MAEPSRAPPFLLESHYLQTKIICTATASKRPPLDSVARVAKACAHPPRLVAGTRFRLTKYLATNQCTQSCDRTNVCMYHLDHLLQLPWAPDPRVAPTETARFKSLYQEFLDCGGSRDFKTSIWWHHFRSRGFSSRTLARRSAAFCRASCSASSPSHPVPISAGPRVPHSGQRRRLHSASMGTSAMPHAMNRPRSMRALWPHVQRPWTIHFG